ncbi:MAG: glutathione S-transferase [Oceanicaulis sp.]|uniref:Glutathione S-transferase n=1 Tax=Maricaulis virginensis TaxID=144022 RepID=A0A9W6IPW9_9PROT|nr:MAPEG family protein [Maricaulis virginensis]MBI75791.1 glutathione S-transferase [Oceanicaulis sp.]GLK53040.1 hypothetical protein GCM10017621_25480 [Maricaulis virginensis]
MSALQAVGLYSALNLLILLVLAANVSRHRRRAKVSLGTGTDPLLEQAIRAHGNGVECVPLALLALFLTASLGYGAMIVHALGIGLTLGRFVYSYGLLTSPGPSMGRMIGTGLTWLVLLAEVLLLLAAAIS